MIKLETHCHSKPSSRCGRITVDIILPQLKAKGYDAVVLTNHYYGDDARTPQQIFDEMVRDYEDMKRLGVQHGVKVFFGAELRYVCDGANDYLLYGMTPQELLEMGDIYYQGPKDFYRTKPEYVIVYQAHPFRDKMTRADPEFLDGIEVYNGHPNHDARNHLALEWARKHGKHKLSGSDTHFEEGIGRGGVFLPRMPEDERDLARLILGVTESDLIITP